MKFLSFYRLSVLTAVLFLMLAFILIFAPAQMLTSWGVELNTSAELLARRVAALYTGIAVMFFMARNAEDSATRTALIYGTITFCMLLALLGIYQFVSGHATSGILAGVFIEFALAVAFLYVNARKK